MKNSYKLPTLALSILAGFTGLVTADEEAKKTGESKCCTVLPVSVITNPVFIKQDAKKKEVEVFITATFDKSNYGMNFNGVSKSEGGYEIPLDWKVKVTFTNNSAVPHSLIVVEADLAARKINLGDTPYFDGANTPKPNTLGTTNKVEKFEFTADEEGEYSFACGFPTHSANGHRIYLNIKKDLKEAKFIMPPAAKAAE